MCDKNRECESYLETAYILAGGKYNAGASFGDNYFMISGINPKDSTIRVIFHDEASRRMMMDAGKDVLKNLYIYWWSGAPERWIYAFTNPEDEPSRQDIFVHLGESEEKWLEPNQEVELKVPDFDFSVLKTSRIFFFAESKNGRAESDRDLTECMSTIENLAGYECQAMFDEFGTIVYRPAKIKEKTEKISTSNIEVPTTTEVSADPIANNSTEQISTSIMRVPENVSVADTTPETLETPANTTPDNTIEVPLVASKEKDHPFPWWLVVFIFSGIFLILWWFVPIRRKKDEKNS